MGFAYCLTLRNIKPSPSLKNAIDQKMEKLEGLYPRLVSGRVVIESPNRRHHHGNLVVVHIYLTTGGSKGVIVHQRDQDVQVAIRDAFEAIHRQLQDLTKRGREKVRNHKVLPRASVSKLFLEEGYGFIESPDGREIYFHRNSVHGDGFDQLQVGTELHFSEEMGEQGPQAVSIKPVRRRRQ